MRFGRLQYFFVLMICVLFVGPNLLAQSATAAAADPDIQYQSNLVHFGDVVDVDVVGSFEFDWRGTLTPEGYLNGLEHLGDQVYALCRNEADLARDIENGLRKILREPKVVVKIVDRSNRAMAILEGAVKNPQRFQIRRPIRLNELFSFSGGITDRASGDILIFRPQGVNCSRRIEKKAPDGGEFVEARQGNGPQMLNIRISDLLSGKADANPQILSGDIVTVLEATPIYVMGGVNSPREVFSRSRMTLTRVIASAGGLAKDAREEEVTIFRRDGKTSSIIEADLKAIKDKKAEDVILKPFDIVEVGQKGRAKRKFPPVLSTVAGDGARTVTLPVRIIE